MAIDDAVGAIRVEVRARGVSVVVPFNVTPKEAFVLMEDACPALLVLGATPSDETAAAESPLTLPDVPGTVDWGVWDLDERDEIVESVAGASKLPDATRLPLLMDCACTLTVGSVADEPGTIEGFLVTNRALGGSSFVGLEEIDGAATFVWDEDTAAGFAAGAVGLDPPAPRFQTFATSFFAEEKKPKRDVCFCCSVGQISS